MAYADHSQSSSRTISIVIVAIIHAVLGYAFVTGLGMKYVKKAAEQLNVIDVKEEPPPPDEEPPPPPPEKQVEPPPVVAPPPIVQTPVVAPPIQTVRTPPPVFNPVPVAAPPPPPAPVVSKAAGAKGNPASWVSSDDYPASALRAEAEGTSAITWEINEQGRVENCRVTSSSGNADLDEAACKAMTRRGRYTPAVDQNGSPIRSSQSRRIVWRLPQ
ncbi:MAG: energy transducer TonB [Sphingobium phenoxybenzoativorans]|uniref:Energy transducer TonB n=1 Tax=Sphingobium phenoxybenzoativorans TaxID=1592790 RepID=A0A975Q135_9SPHN|nr:energy transducer TonB [Sphingobium phenoxybenzoativorans]QUT05008.1 energy transducer TonB [Sphingobium phenoxybenzoativorans]